MFSVTFREGILLLAILAALVLGAAVKHWRDARREVPAPTSTTVPTAPR